MQQVVQHTFVVDTNRERAWTFLWDIEAVAKCIPGCEDVTEQEPGVSYRARVRRSVGPFLIRFELTIAVTETVPLQRLQALVSGEDKRLRSSVEQKIEISLDEISQGQCQIQITTDFRLTGMLAALGEGLLAAQVREELDTFVKSVNACLRDRTAKAANLT